VRGKLLDGQRLFNNRALRGKQDIVDECGRQIKPAEICKHFPSFRVNPPDENSSQLDSCRTELAGEAGEANDKFMKITSGKHARYVHLLAGIPAPSSHLSTPFTTKKHIKIIFRNEDSKHIQIVVPNPKGGGPEGI
jgi:hypothetical protein